MRKLFGGKPAKTDPNDPKTELRGHVFKVNRHNLIVESRVAEGGFAIVLLTKDARSGRYFALKRQFVNDLKQLEAVKREIKIIETFSDHPNIIRFVDAAVTPHGEDVYECMLVTKYYKKTVLQLMNQNLAHGRFFPEAEVLKIFCDMCEAVARLHHSQTPVIHRDLKVENILIDDDNSTYVLCDFGSATTKIYSTATHSRNQIEDELTKYTTLSYRSPEMVDLYQHGGGHAITTKSDVWAMGVLLYKLAYFALPFGDSSLAIQNATYTLPDSPAYSAELTALIRFMLEPDPSRRPDIYQVSSVAFRIAGRKNPIPNLHGSQEPSIARLLHHHNHSLPVTSIATGSVSAGPSTPAYAQPAAGHGVVPSALCYGTPSKITTSRSFSSRHNQTPSPMQVSTAETSVTPRERPKGLRTNVPGPKDQSLVSFRLQQSANIIESVSNPDIAGRVHRAAVSEPGSRQLQNVASNAGNSNLSVMPGSGSVQVVAGQRLQTRTSDSSGSSRPEIGASQSMYAIGSAAIGNRQPSSEPPSNNNVVATPVVASMQPPTATAPATATKPRIMVAPQPPRGAPSATMPLLSADHPVLPLASDIPSHLRSHRRNVSDTSAVRLTAAGSGRPSAFRPYQPSGSGSLGSNQLVATHGDQGAGLDAVDSGQGQVGRGAPQDQGHLSGAVVPSVPGALASSAVVHHHVPVTVASSASLDSCQSATQMPPGGPPWNPFERGRLVPPGGTMMLRDPDLDDSSFGQSFDRLPRRGSASSISNVKSRESLVMADVDPFGAAPFNPKDIIEQKMRSDSKLSKGKRSLASVTGFTKERSGSQQSNTAEAAQPPGAATGLVSLVVPPSLVARGQDRYQKLVDTDEDEGEEEPTPTASDAKPVAPTSSGGASGTAQKDGEPILEGDEDSIGSCSSLRQSMQAATTDESGDLDDFEDNSSRDEDGPGGDATGASSSNRLRTKGHPMDFYGYEHFESPPDPAAQAEQNSSDDDAGGETSVMSGQDEVTVRQTGGHLKGEGRLQHAPDLGNGVDEVDILADRLGHKPLLDDDELDVNQVPSPSATGDGSGIFAQHPQQPTNSLPPSLMSSERSANLMSSAKPKTSGAEALQSCVLIAGGSGTYPGAGSSIPQIMYPAGLTHGTRDVRNITHGHSATFGAVPRAVPQPAAHSAAAGPHRSATAFEGYTETKSRPPPVNIITSSTSHPTGFPTVPPPSLPLPSGTSATRQFGVQQPHSAGDFVIRGPPPPVAPKPQHVTRLVIGEPPQRSAVAATQPPPQAASGYYSQHQLPQSVGTVHPANSNHFQTQKLPSVIEPLVDRVRRKSSTSSGEDEVGEEVRLAGSGPPERLPQVQASGARSSSKGRMKWKRKTPDQTAAFVNTSFRDEDFDQRTAAL